MNESSKTMTFVISALALTAAAGMSHFMNQPSNSADFELVGKPFFEAFESADQVQSLEVVALDPETTDVRRFAVENSDGLWRIPSHYNYPAEAAARLATTASSVMGIERESLAGRLAKEHERLGVIDPLDEEFDDPDAVGRRITMRDADGEVVVDYIIGKEAGEVVLDATEEPFANNDSTEKFYFVRRPDEQQTYKVKLDIDLSTKFSDWIDPDLLRIERSELIGIEIDNYQLTEQGTNPIFGGATALVKSQGDQLALTRKSPTDSWELNGLDPEKEELENSRVTDIMGVVDGMKLAGVRPKRKFKGHFLLTPDLKLNRQPEFEEDPQAFSREIQLLQAELEDKGFNIAGSAEQLELVSRNGDITLTTEKGVVYVLQVGESLDGDEKEIEVGDLGSGEEDDKKSEDIDDSDETEAGKENADGETGQETEAEADDSPNRFLMVRVLFDESKVLGKPEKPTEPVEPKKPENYQPEVKEDPSEKTETEKDAGAKAPDDVEPPKGVDEDAESENDDEEKKPQRNPESIKFDADKAAFEKAKVDYEVELSTYEDELKAYNAKVEEGKSLVAELNERFGDWYYVISADNLKTLQTSREDLVKAKAAPEGQATPSTPLPPRPNISFPGLPGGEKPAVEKPAAEAAEEMEAPKQANEQAKPEDNQEEKGDLDKKRGRES